MLLNSQRLLKPLKITNSCNLTRTLFTTKYLLNKSSEESQNNHQFNNTLLLPKTDFPLRNDILKTEAKYRPKLSEELYEWQVIIKHFILILSEMINLIIFYYS
jgi:hypothetical protein